MLNRARALSGTIERTRYPKANTHYQKKSAPSLRYLSLQKKRLILISSPRLDGGGTGGARRVGQEGLGDTSRGAGVAAPPSLLPLFLSGRDRSSWEETCRQEVTSLRIRRSKRLGMEEKGAVTGSAGVQASLWMGKQEHGLPPNPSWLRSGGGAGSRGGRRLLRCGG